MKREVSKKSIVWVNPKQKGGDLGKPKKKKNPICGELGEHQAKRKNSAWQVEEKCGKGLKNEI